MSNPTGQLATEDLEKLRAARRKDWREVLMAHGFALWWTAVGLFGVCHHSSLFIPWHLYWFMGQVCAAMPSFAWLVIVCMFLLPVWLLRCFGAFRHGGTRQLRLAGFRVRHSTSALRRFWDSVRSAALPNWCLGRLNRRGTLDFEYGLDPLPRPAPVLSILVISLLISLHHLAFLTALDTMSCGRTPWYVRLPSWGNAECQFGVRVPEPVAPTKLRYGLPPWCG